MPCRPPPSWRGVQEDNAHRRALAVERSGFQPPYRRFQQLVGLLDQLKDSTDLVLVVAVDRANIEGRDSE